MAKKLKVADLPNFDMAEMLETEADVANYLTLVLDENDMGGIDPCTWRGGPCPWHECGGSTIWPEQRGALQGTAPRFSAAV